MQVTNKTARRTGMSRWILANGTKRSVRFGRTGVTGPRRELESLVHICGAYDETSHACDSLVRSQCGGGLHEQRSASVEICRGTHPPWGQILTIPPSARADNERRSGGSVLVTGRKQEEATMKSGIGTGTCVG